MKIRILNSGEIRHIDNSTGTALISAGLAEEVASSEGDKPSRLPRYNSAAIPQPEFSIQVMGEENKHLAIRMLLGQSVSYYFGHPDKANEKDRFHFFSGFGREIPGAVLRAYKKEWKSNEHLRAPLPDPKPARCEENEATASALRQCGK